MQFSWLISVHVSEEHWYMSAKGHGLTELQKYRITHSFYSITEFYELNKNRNDL
jgi:hypothetical protein